jgi:hypothetical protein
MLASVVRERGGRCIIRKQKQSIRGYTEGKKKEEKKREEGYRSLVNALKNKIITIMTTTTMTITTNNHPIISLKKKVILRD